jgi:hypothetical protein
VTTPTVSVSAPSRRKLLIVSGVLAVATVALGFVAVGQFRSERAYVSAPRCTTAGSSSTSCRLMIPATVTEVVVSSGTHASYKLRLAGPQPVSGNHGFPSDDGVMAMSDPGDHVTAEVWRGHVVAVSDGIFHTFTSDAPIYRERQWSSGALAAGLFAIVFALAWAWNVRRIKNFLLVTTLRGGRAVAYLVVLVAAVSALCTALLELAVPDSPELVLLGGFFVVLAVVIGFFYWRGVRKMATIRSKGAAAA